MESITAQCAAHSIGPANQLFTILIQTILSAQCSISPPEKWPSDFGPRAIENGLDEYDFIVIGSGSAGSAVAGRLSENENWKILLLEAGDNPPIESEIPYMFFANQKTPNDWGFYTECERDGCRGTKRGNFWPRGKELGGSSGINAMIYIRGNRRDYDNWAKLGNPTWDWYTVLEYFKKSEDNQNPLIAGDVKNHGTGGLLKISSYENNHLSKEILVKSFRELGYKDVIDVNGDEYLGIVTGQNTIDNGMRYSSAKAFLIPAKDRSNLHIIKNAHATKIEFNNDKSISGVRFFIKEQELFARSRKEIILSAGSIGSPQILMNSGIGPENHLKQFNINVIQNAAVGKNLQDHILVPYFVKFNKPIDDPYSFESDLQNLYQFAVNRSGLFSTIGITHLMAFVSTVNDAKYPNIQYHFFFLKQNDPFVRHILNLFGYHDEIVNSVENANKDAAIALVGSILLNPKSVGKIELQSANPFDAPKIYGNYFDEQEDINISAESMKILRKLSDTKVFKDADVEEVIIDIPGCRGLLYDTDEYWQCYVKQLASTLYHPVGTVKMGPDSDNEAVVDGTLLVKGVSGLRVADASIMPKIVSGNTNAPTIMIGEKVADFIKAKWLHNNNNHNEL